MFPSVPEATVRNFARRFGVLVGALTLAVTMLAVPASASSAPDVWITRATSFCLNTAGSANGVPAVVVVCNDTSNDFWNINQLSGYQTIVNVNTGRCLTATSATSGAAVVQSTCVGSQAQKWNVPNNVSTFNMLITSLISSGLCLAAPPTANAPAKTVDCGTPANRWSLLY